MAGGALKSKTKEFLCLLQESSEFLQETSCRTFGRAKSNFKSESDGGSLFVRPASTFVSVPCPHPSFFHLLVLLIVLLQELPVEIVGNQACISKSGLASMVASSKVQESSCSLPTHPPSSPHLHHNQNSLCHSMQAHAKSLEAKIHRTKFVFAIT